ncbi:NAD(P)/FAD-dependent oxidoreductase, partial [Candidatus Woesearchaeota archaeon]|nr:NAD(P)/FAD-dependent oxidoreductase [Candidatus Woesearchaeota archaeon]
IIVGAGPAGSSAAYFSGNLGLDLLLLDKKEFPRAKLCSGGISPRTLKTLDEMNFGHKIERKYHKVIGGKIIAPNGAVIEGNIPKTEKYRDYGYVIHRTELDKMLRDHGMQTKNSEFRQEEAIDLIIDAGYVKGVKTESNEKIYSKAVILADGANSRLAEKYGLIAPCKEKTIIALESWREHIEVKDRFVIYYHEKLLPGYFWIFPEGDGKANVGLGFWGLSKYKETDIYDVFKEIQASKQIDNLLQGSNITHEPKAWTIRFRDPKKIPIGNGVIAIGDSGGFANPFTGEGIYYALESGKFAAMAVKKALETGDVSADGLKHFQELCAEEFEEDVQFSHVLRKIFGNAEIINSLAMKASVDPDLNSLLQGILVNVKPKGQILQFVDENILR